MVLPGNSHSMCLPHPLWEREVDSVTSEKKFGGREQGLPNAVALTGFLGTVILLTTCLELLLPQSGEDGQGVGSRRVCGGGAWCCREWVWAEVARLPGFSLCRKCRFGCKEWNVPSCPPRTETAVEELEKKITK